MLLQQTIRWLLHYVALALLLEPALALAEPLRQNNNDSLLFKGIVLAKPASGRIGGWQVGERLFQADAATSFPEGTPVLGSCVAVEYSVVSNQNLVRSMEHDPICGAESDENKIYGIVSAQPDDLYGEWTVGGQRYLVREGTTRFNQQNGVATVGSCVELHTRLDVPVLVATRIESKQPYECRVAGEDNLAYGTIGALPAGGPVGAWQIGGLFYLVTTATQLRAGAFGVGLLVEVHFVRADDGTLLATAIEGKYRPNGSEPFLAKAYGRVARLPATSGLLGVWEVSGSNYRVMRSTQLPPATTQFALNGCVELYYRVVGRVRVALKIQTASEDNCPLMPGTTFGRVYGFVGVLPQTGLVGRWAVGGGQYQVDATTAFEFTGGPLTVGAFVEISAALRDGVQLAVRIETHVPPGAGDELASGTLAMADSSAVAAMRTWYIAGQAYQVADATMLDDSRAALVAGRRVLVNYYADAAGTRVATAIAVLLDRPRAYVPLVVR